MIIVPLFLLMHWIKRSQFNYWNHKSCSYKSYFYDHSCLLLYTFWPIQCDSSIYIYIYTCVIFLLTLTVERKTAAAAWSVTIKNIYIFFNTQVVKCNAKNTRHLPHYKCLYCLFKLLWTETHPSILRFVLF